MARYKQIDNDQARKLVMDFFNYSRNSNERVDFIKDYDIGYKKYLMYKAGRKEELRIAKQDWRSNLFVPMTFTIVETFVPHTLLSLVANDVIVAMKPTNRDDFAKAKVAQQLTTMQFMEDDGKEKYEMLIKDAAIGAWSAGKVMWYADKVMSTQISKRRKSFNVAGIPLRFPGINEDYEEEVERYRFNGPSLVQLDPKDCYPDVSKSTIKTGRAFLREFLLYTDEVEAYAEEMIFENKSEVKAMLLESGTENMTESMQRRMETLDKTITSVDGIKAYLIKEYIEDDRTIYLGNDKFVLTNRNNPNWHKMKDIVDVKAIPIPHKFYPKSLSWACNDMQNLANDTFNQKADNVRFLLNSQMAVVEDEILYNSDLVPRPGGRVRVKSDVRAIAPIAHENVTQDAYAQSNELDMMAQNASGIYNIMKGAMERKETATVGAMLANAAGTRLQATIMRIAETMVKRHFMLMVELDRENLTDERMIEYVGEDARDTDDFRYIDRHSMPQGIINYVPETVLEQKREIDRKASLDYYNLLYGKPEFDQYSLAEAVTQFMPFSSKSHIILTREQYTERQERMARQQESLDLKGSNEEAVIPPIAGEVRNPGLKQVANQSLSPELMRRTDKGPGEERRPTGK